METIITKQTTQTLITHYFLKKVKSNYCVECGIDMGPQNPRQLCGKYQCIGIKLTFILSS